MPKRIHILGAAGSGKTQLASRVAKLSGCQAIHLDMIAYDDAHAEGFQHPTSRTERLEKVSQYSQTPSWIAEGAYFSWCGQSFKYSDLIVLLEVPRDVRVSNLRTRHGTDSPRLDYLIEQTTEYDALFEERIAGFLEPFSDKIRKFSGAGKAFAFLQKRLRIAP